ncbi:TPA: hypothetical protein ACH3X3_005341 [Trebouxia sp. C0006]
MTNTFGLLEDHLASDEDQEDDSDDQTSYGLGFDLQASDAAAAAFLFQTGTASSARGWGVSAGPPASHLSTDAGIDEGLWQQVERKGTRKVKVPESKGTARAGALRNYRPPYTPAQSSVEQQWDVRPAYFSFGHQQLHLPRPAESRHTSHSQQQGFEPSTSSLGSLGGNTLSISRNRREGTQVQTFYLDQGAPSSPSAVAQRSHLAGAQAHLSLLATNTDQHVLHSSGHSTLQLDLALKDLRWQLTEHASAAMELKPDTVNMLKETANAEKQWVQAQGTGLSLDGLEPFVMPVMAADGYVYERCEIQDWIGRNNSSPVTSVPFLHQRLTAHPASLEKLRELQAAFTPAGFEEFQEAREEYKKECKLRRSSQYQ